MCSRWVAQRAFASCTCCDPTISRTPLLIDYAEQWSTTGGQADIARIANDIADSLIAVSASFSVSCYSRLRAPRG